MLTVFAAISDFHVSFFCVLLLIRDGCKLDCTHQPVGKSELKIDRNSADFRNRGITAK